MKTVRLLGLLALIVAFAAIANERTIPTGNTSATRFDTLIVLGVPARLDGGPSLPGRARVDEAVREYKAGVAPHIIMTGGAAHNRFLEAHTMAVLAVSEGVPESAIVEEPQALNTIQNIYFSEEIMAAHGWKSAEVVSSSNHLGRAALILGALAKKQPALKIDWRTHAAPWPSSMGPVEKFGWNTYEALRCLEIRIFGFPRSHFLP